MDQGEKYYHDRQRHLSQLNELSEQVEETIEDDQTRLLFMGRMPGHMEVFTGQKSSWQAFKHWLFTAMYWLVKETDENPE